MTTNYPTLGVGLGFRTPFAPDLFIHRDEVDFLEIIADHYLDATPEKMRELELLGEHFTLIPHAIGLSLGSAEGLDVHYVERLAGLIERVNPPWWSEHIAFTHAGGADIGHLAPLPFTQEAVDVLGRNVAMVKERIERPLILENITYSIAMPGAEMPETEFLRRVIDSTQCGLLLDVTNLYTNASNHGFDPRRFLDAAPIDRAVQVHFAGGEWKDGELVDSHAQATPPEVWSLLDDVLGRVNVRAVMVERDENLPPFSELVGEMRQARAMGRRHGRWT